MLNPLAQVAIFALVLSNVLQAKIGNVDNQYSFALYLCAGLACWNLFNDIVSRSLNLFIAKASAAESLANSAESARERAEAQLLAIQKAHWGD